MTDQRLRFWLSFPECPAVKWMRGTVGILKAPIQSLLSQHLLHVDLWILTFQWHLWLTRWGTSSNNPLLQWNHFWDRSNKVNHSHLNMSLFVLHSLLNRVFNQTQEFNSNIKFAIGYHSRRENKILLIIHTHIYYCDEYLGILNLNIDFCITTYNHSVWKY